MRSDIAPRLPELARAWVAGWAVSRGTATPVEERWGLRVDVGLPEHNARHVLLDTDEFTVRTAAWYVGAPGIRIKAFVPLGTLVSWAGAHWEPDWQNPAFLMAADLRSGSKRPPSGYRVLAETDQALTHVRVLACDGSPVARGQIAVTGESAVVDRVRTDPAHRRRGLATLVMHVLADIATAQGATVGILAASADGQALYDRLGWTVHSPLAGVAYRTVST